MNENMKPSGIDWIGEIPESWSVQPMKYKVTFHNGDRGDNYPSKSEMFSEGIPFINAGHITDTGLDLDNMDYITDDKYNHMGGVKLKVNDILYCLRGSVGKNAIISIDKGTVASSLVSIRAYNINPKFLFYCLNSDLEETQRKLYDNGTAQPNLSADNLGKYKITIPKSIEQTLIADFLDERCEKIDSIVTDVEKQIEILQKYKKSLITETVTKGLDKSVPMKDSGIKWIGDIPEHYSLVPLKNLFWMYAGGDVDECDFSDERTEKYKYAIYSNSLKNSGLFGYMSKYRFKGDTITVTGRGDVGKALPRYDAYYPIVRLLVCVPQKKLSVSFFSYCINCTDILGDQTAMAQLTTQKLGVIKVPVPAYEEQTKIANYLDSKCLKIDSIIGSKKDQLIQITQNKKSLIYEYVTGKKRVKGANENGN